MYRGPLGFARTRSAPHTTRPYQAEYAGGIEQEGGCMLIALATHGRRGLQRLLMGSVTERALRSTRLPLLVVRPQEKSGRAHVQAKGKKIPGVGGNRENEIPPS